MNGNRKGEYITRVTQEQITNAKKWDALNYLQTFEPEELVRCGRGFCTKTHDSLRISKNGLWNWFSQNIGGQSALSYLVKVKGMKYLDAVLLLCEQDAPVERKDFPKSDSKPFKLPIQSNDFSMVYHYLKKRGIDPWIVNQCHKQAILYQSARFNNCVFIGKDLDGIPRFASLRSTNSDFKIDVEGSDKRYNFCFNMNRNANTVAVYESAIEALSGATIALLENKTIAESFYLSASGTSPLALLNFLRDHPQAESVCICYNNDEAGRKGTDTLFKILTSDPLYCNRLKSIEVNLAPKQYGKDYNQYLLGLKQNLRTRNNLQKGER